MSRKKIGKKYEGRKVFYPVRNALLARLDI